MDNHHSGNPTAEFTAEVLLLPPLVVAKWNFFLYFAAQRGAALAVQNGLTAKAAEASLLTAPLNHVCLLH